MKRMSATNLFSPDRAAMSLSYKPKTTSIVAPLAPGRADTAPTNAPATAVETWSSFMPLRILACLIILSWTGAGFLSFSQLSSENDISHEHT